MNVQSKIEDAATLYSAMALAFAEIEGATKGKLGQVGQQKYKYADLGSVIDAIKPALIKHGLFFTQCPEPVDGGVCIATHLYHSSGYNLPLGKLFVPANQNNAQGFGSALTYARRYALVTAFGVPVEDDDGSAAVKGQSQQGAVSHPVEDEKFPDGPAKGITQMKSMARALWREIEGCGDDSELNGLLGVDANKALMKQMAALENPQHREIWEGDGKDNPGLAGLITKKETEFAQRMVNLGNT